MEIPFTFKGGEKPVFSICGINGTMLWAWMKKRIRIKF